MSQKVHYKKKKNLTPLWHNVKRVNEQNWFPFRDFGLYSVLVFSLCHWVLYLNNKVDISCRTPAVVKPRLKELLILKAEKMLGS